MYQFIGGIILIIFLSLNAKAREVRTLKLDCFINAMIKDHQGIMWLGTECGLKTYDGYEIANVAGPLEHRKIYCLIEDKKRGVIWVGTKDGIYMLNYATREIKKESSKSTAVQAFALREVDGMFFALYFDGILMSLDTQGSKMKIKLPILQSKPIVAFYEIMKTGLNNDLIFAAAKDFYRYDLGTFKLTKLNFNYSSKRVYSQAVQKQLSKFSDEVLARQLKYDPSYVGRFKDKIILGSFNRGVRILNAKNYSDITPPLFDSLFYCLRESYAQKYALAGDMLYTYNGLSGEVYAVDMNNYKIYENWEVKKMPQTGWSTPVFADQNRILWINTTDGLTKLVCQDKQFESFLSDPREKMEGISTRQIMEDSAGDLYVSFYNGMFYRSKATGKWTRYSYFTNGLLDDPKSGYIYATSESSFPFSRFNKNTKKPEFDFYKADSLEYLMTKKKIYGYCLVMDSARMIWIGYNYGLAIYNPANSVLKLQKGNSFDIGNYAVNYIKQSKLHKNILYVGSENGLYVLDIKKGVQKHFSTSSKPALTSNVVYAIEEDAPGQIWIGTRGGGINIIAKDGNKIQYLNTTNSNLASNIIYGLLWGQANVMWASTQNGLSEYNLRTNAFLNFGVQDGLNSLEFNRNSLLKGRDGKLYFGGVNGINAFYPEKIAMGWKKNYLFVSAVSLWNDDLHRDVFVKDLKNEIILQPNERSIKFFMGTSDFTSPENNKYFYRISNSGNQSWIPLGTQNVLSLESLPTGRYSIELTAKNAVGMSTLNTLNFPVWVKKPFYNKWWFYVLIFICSTGLIYYFFWLRLQSFKRIQLNRMQIASDLHDEIGGLITGISIMSASLKNQNLNLNDKESKIAGISKMTWELTDAIRDVLWTVDIRNDKLETVVSYMRDYIYSMQSLTIAVISFDCADVYMNRRVSSVHSQNLFRIFKETLNNAIKHSTADYIKIIYVHKDNHFKFSIENNGLKPDLKKETVGQGLKNIALRAKKIGSEVIITKTEQYFKVTLIANK